MERIACANSTSVEQLPPLQHAIDVEALTTLVLSGDSVCVQFVYADCTIVVHEEAIEIQ
ncbi:HalOD1 output domain-containing protein [Natronocalculus amylovorans]|uniref:HalOD1 output domain-containing protein n=1 Tax=Natronocalculus amylovorans TaxID=2917812 RepID=UPI00267444D3|nr:HalOD1 output domain-containing protein [Natronocalculus amylovorans]